jgi:hypothetical protein
MFKIIVRFVHVHLVIKTIKFFNVDIINLFLVCFRSSRLWFEIDKLDYWKSRQCEKFIVIFEQSDTIRDFETKFIKMHLHFHYQIAKRHCAFISIWTNIQISKKKLFFIQNESRVIFWLLELFENTIEVVVQKKTFFASW